MKKRKIITSVIAAAAAVVIVGGTVYAASPEVREMVRQVITINPIPQYPVEGFRMLEDIGTMLPKNSVRFEDFPFDFETVYAVNAEKTGENSYAVDNIAYGNGYVIVLCNEDGSGFHFEQGQQGTVNIVADLSAEYTRGDDGELSEVGYIFDGKATSLFNGRIGEEGVAVDFTAETAGEYEFYIINYCAGLQNYKSITVENRNSTEEFYKIQNAWENRPADIKAIEEGITVTENDFTEFAEGIRAKLVSVVNSGSFAEVILEFEFDRPVKDGEYALEDVIISSQSEYLFSYGCGFLTVTDSGRIYSTVQLNNIENIPADKTMTMEIKTLDKANSQNVHNTDETYGDDQSVKVCGSFSADFTVGTPIKPFSVNIEPAEVSWTHHRMGGETAHMEISGLKYSPKAISVDLRMLEDCLVIYSDDIGGSQCFNNTQIFCDGIVGDKEAMPLKLKMSDGSLSYVWYYNVSSNAVNDIDKNTLVTDMDWIKASWDIYSDKPTTVTFELAGIVDYTDVEAIVFCGKEIPITEKDF